MKGLGGVLKEPPTATADDQQQALDILTLCVTDAELKRIVVKERTGTAAWKGLRRHMLKLGEAQKIAIRTTFGNLKLGPKESLAEYFSRGRQLQADFNEIEDFEAEERGEASNRSPAITDADLIRQLFAGLAGTAWGSNVATPMLASIDINTESLDDLLNRMMWVGATMRVAGASSSGDATTGGGGGAIVPALAAGGGGGGGGPNPHAGKRCYSCGKIGHIKSQCRNKGKKGQQQQQQAGSGQQQQQQPKQHPSRFGPNHVALAAAMFGGSSGGSEPPAEKDQRIYLDSGCKRHLVRDKSMLHDFRPSNGRVHIRWGNGKSSVVEGSGTLVLRRSSGENRERLGQDVHGNKWDVNWSGGQGSCLVVRNVFYVPGASFNLLSVRTLGDKGLRTLFDGDAGYVLSRDNSKDVYSAGGLMYLAAGHSVMMKASRVDDVGLYAISSHNWEQSPAAVDAGDASCDNADETLAGSYNSDYIAAAPAAAGAPAPVTGAGAGGQVACGKAAGPGHGSAVVLAHRRLGHLNFQYLERLAANGMVTGLKVTAEQCRREACVCHVCQMSKLARVPHPPSDSHAGRVLGLIHMDLCGPVGAASLGGAKYVATFYDDHSHFSIVRFLDLKSEIPSTVREVIELMENQCEARVMAVRTDRGREYVSAECEGFFRGKGIRHDTSAAYTPQSNGKAERINRTLFATARAMLIESGLPHSLWAEAVNTANVLRNRSPVAGQDVTPWESFTGTKPNVSFLRVFGARAFVRTPEHERSGKLDPKARAGRLVGYDTASGAYRVLMDGELRRGNRAIVVSKDVSFDESDTGMLEAAEAYEQGFEKPSDESFFRALMPVLMDDSDDEDDTGAAPPVGSVGSTAPDDDDYESVGSIISDSSDEAAGAGAAGGPNIGANAGGNGNTGAAGAGERRYPNRNRSAPNRYVPAGAAAAVDSAASIDTPQTLEEAMASPHRELWLEAINDELQSLQAKGTWELVALPKGAKALPTKWVFQVKLKSDGSLERCKARLVAKGCAQREGIDYEEVFAPTSKQGSLRTLLALAAERGMSVRHLDVRTAFLNGELDEEVYVKQPPGFSSSIAPEHVCRLKKALYGLKQAGRAWHRTLKAALIEMGFVECEADPGIFVLRGQGAEVYLLHHVDDLLLACTDSGRLSAVLKRLKARFDMRDLGEANFFLGMEIARMVSGEIKLSQKKYTAELLARWGMEDSAPKAVPLSPSTKLTRVGGDSRVMEDESKYRELVGGLMYLAVGSRPDIAQAVALLARFMSKPAIEHWNTAKGVLRYLCGSRDMGIVFSRGGDGLVGYCDADWAGDTDTRRSTTGYVFLYNGAAISWQSKLQRTVAVATSEAEYMAAASATREAVWLRKLFGSLGVQVAGVRMLCDNQGAVSIIKNPIISERSKHIDIQHHFVRERHEAGEVTFEFCPTSDMVADSLTKAVGDAKFVFCRNSMAVR